MIPYIKGSFEELIDKADRLLDNSICHEDEGDLLLALRLSTDATGMYFYDF